MVFAQTIQASKQAGENCKQTRLTNLERCPIKAFQSFKRTTTTKATSGRQQVKVSVKWQLLLRTLCTMFK